MSTTLDTILTMIAADELGIETLERRNSDSLDFHEIGVYGIRRALELSVAVGRSWDKAHAAAAAELTDDIDRHLELLEEIKQEVGSFGVTSRLYRLAFKVANKEAKERKEVDPQQPTGDQPLLRLFREVAP